MNNGSINSSLIIEASAGSGKTYQLINRLVQLLLKGANPANIVAITFTRKASAELQTRLQERLYDLATVSEETLSKQLLAIGLEASSTISSKARCLYEEVIFSPQSVRCTTFHSFCQEILKRFPFEAEVPPGFELSEQTSHYQQQAWQALMSECQQKETPSTSNAISFLFEEFGLNNTRDILNSFLNQRSDWWAWTQQAKNPVGYAISKMQDCLKVDPNAEPLSDFFKQTELDDTLSQFGNHLDKLKADKFKKWLDILSYVRDTSLDNAIRYQHIQSAFLTKEAKPKALKSSKEMCKLFGDDGAESFIQSHIDICVSLETLKNDLNLIKSYHVNKNWYVAGTAYLEHYQDIKFSLRQLDFTDLEWQAYRLLTKSQHALWIQYKLDSRINHLLIDEFQDTNPIQWHLLQPLIEEFSQHQEDDTARSVLLVGDTKQSIYRFRRAEPKLFPIASAFIEEQFESSRMQLNASWRSSPAIINFVNTIFSSTSLGNVIKDFPKHETEQKKLSGNVTLLEYPVLVDSSEDKSDVASEDVSFRNPLLQPRPVKQSEHQLEAQIIADKISTLISNKQLVTVNKQTRAIQYQDIIILLRNRTNAAHYEKALHHQSIPFVGSERGTLLECLEVKDIVLLLNWLITPFNNVALASILRSPLFSVSDLSLIKIAEIQPKETGQSNWFSKIEFLLSKKECQLEPSLQEAVRLLKNWQELATKIPVHDLLDVIYSEADVLEQYHRAYPTHLKSRTRTNLTRLIELALEIDSGRYPSLQQFIAHIERIKNSADESPDTPAASNDKNRVQVMTIHASKGLEAPVIFLANADSEGTAKYTYKSIIDWPVEKDTPLMMMLSSTTKDRDNVTSSFIEKDTLAQQREAANLFYVAITRARQYLYISAAKKTKNNSDWYSLIHKCYDMKASGGDGIVLEEFVSDNDSKTTTKSENKSLSTVVDDNLRKKININTAYTDIQKTISPSNLEKSKPLVAYTDKQPDSDVKNRGIIIHAILEAIGNNSKVSNADCRNTIGQNLTDKVWNTYWEEASQVVNNNDFSMFFNSNSQAFNEVSVSYLDSNGVTVYGIIDRVVIINKDIHIIDYKTHQTVSNKNIQDYALQYEGQLEHYQNAAQRIWPKHTIKSYLLFTHSLLLHEYKAVAQMQLI